MIVKQTGGTNPMANKLVKINRAPVLTLWASVVAERLGHDRDAALTLGKALSGLNAQSKGKRLGIFSETVEKPAGEKKAARPKEHMLVPLLGRAVPALRTKEGLRAVAKDETIDPQSIQRYLRVKFGEDLDDVRAAMEALAKSYKPEKLDAEAFALYEKFRPTVPEGTKGWGAKGDLDLNKIRSLAK
jgi:hypothetical protein